jgi:hypothetical protein
MASPITKIEHDVLNSTLRCLGEAGGTTDHAEWMRGSGNADRLIRFIDEVRNKSEKNPFKMSVQDQLVTLRRASDRENWAIPEDVYSRLEATPPDWPKGKSAYRLFRIRFGEGDEGVCKTFAAHNACIKHVLGQNCYACDADLLSGEEPDWQVPLSCLRLLNGNHTHVPVIEWALADLGTHRKRKSVMEVRSSKSLADELLVIAWLFPKMVTAINNRSIPGLFAAGYEVNVPRMNEEWWLKTVLVGLNQTGCRVTVSAGHRFDNSPDKSVPELL